MSLHDSRVLTALIRAKLRLKLNARCSDSRCARCGSACHKCGAVDCNGKGVHGGSLERFNPYHVQSGEHGGEFTTGSGEKKPSKRQTHRETTPKRLKAVEKLQAKYDANPIKRWPDIAIDGDVYHVEVIKNAYKMLEPLEPRYYARAIKHSTGDVDDTSAKNKLADAIKAGERMHKYYVRGRSVHPGIERFNPYHVESGEHGGEFTSGSGEFSDDPEVKEELEAYKQSIEDQKEYFEEQHEIADEEYAKTVKELGKEQEQDKKERIKEQLKDQKEEIKELEATQKDELKEVASDQRQEIKDLTKQHAIEKKELLKDHEEELKNPKEYADSEEDLRVHHQREIEEQAKDHAEQHEDLAKDHAEQTKGLVEQHEQSRKDLLAEHEQSKVDLLNDIKDEHRAAREEAKEAYIEEKQSLDHQFKEAIEEEKDRHREELADIIARLKEDRSYPFGIARKLVMASGKTFKASSAEAILRHCLRSLGFTAAYRQGTLSNEQHIRLLDEIRQYGRAWLRHEAGEFVQGWIAERSGSGSLVGQVLRAADWVEGPGGYLIQSDTGFRHAVGRFFGRAKSFVRELILSATMALSGPAPLTGEELAGADRESQKQEQFFDRFHQETLQPREKPFETPVDTTSQIITLEPAPLTPGQFVARAETYADSAWQSAQRINRGQAVSQAAFKFERRVLGQPKTEHCEDCPPLAALGWQPIGTLPDIGDSECGPLCLCHFRYSEGEGQPEFIQGKRGPLRAPSDVSMLEDVGDVAMVAEPPGGLSERFPIAGPP